MIPLGVTQSGRETLFALYAKHATGVMLLLFNVGGEDPIHEVPLEKEGDIWRITLENLPEAYEYTYRCDGPYEPKKGHLYNKEMDLVDPYAKRLNTPIKWNSEKKPPRGMVLPKVPFNWENDARPMLPLKEMIIYEMHVRGLTQDPSSDVKNPGSYLGVIEKIPYLKKLGINAVELLPIHPFNEQDNPKTNPKTKERLFNYWGYSTANFFSPASAYGTPEEFKEMIKALHASGIEIILDVVYNHTNEGSSENYYYSFRGIDNRVYYIVDERGYHNYSGCGNTFNCNHPIVAQLILDSLRYFVTEYHIDGFRFDLASILTRGEDGNPLSDPPLIKKMTQDPILGPTKLIAEAWDPAGLYQVGKFPSYRFGEWNDCFRNDLRHFIRGDGNKENVKKRLIGSPDLYGNPTKSYNFITIHDGFSLHDLVSYNEKHNEENGENSQDGANDNISWNCGVEGETDDPEILHLRNKQMKNFFHALLIADGIPMLLMGDEYGHTKKGNNNTWCQDSELNYFLWDQLKKNLSLFHFVSELISIRKKYLMKEKKITWIEDPTSPFLGMLINDYLFSAFNPSENEKEWIFPQKKWKSLFDTDQNLQKEKEIEDIYLLKPFSSILLIAT